MKEKGFDYPKPPFAATPRETSFDLLSTEDLIRDGYDIEPKRNPDSYPVASKLSPNPQPNFGEAAYETALSGAEGCLTAAESSANAQYRLEFSKLKDLAEDERRYLVSPARIAIWERWSACMKRTGFVFTDRADAIESFRNAVRADTASTALIKAKASTVAIADSRCIENDARKLVNLRASFEQKEVSRYRSSIG